jgi:uncharacterized protein (DUF362 family)
MPDARACAVAIVDDRSRSPTGRLTAALDGVGFWTILRQVRRRRSADRIRIVVKPELAGFAAGSPAVTDPALVEFLIDHLHDRGFTNVAVVGATDSSALWAENRDLYALSDLLGYRFTTPQERAYDIVDLTGDRLEYVFPVGSALHGCAISRDWIDADVRIVFSKNRTDERAGYALCLDTLIGVLPLIDKDLHYRRRRHPGDVVAALLDAAPIGLCLIDAVVSAHGPCGRRAPVATDTGTIVAATDIVLADHAGALKMGLDPLVSPTFERVLRTHPLPKRYVVTGSLNAYPDWQNVPAESLHASRLRGKGETLDRLVEPWLQCLDATLFPPRHPLDARLNASLAGFFAAGSNSTGQWLLIAANVVLACIDAAIAAYQTLFDKDALRRQAVPLGFDVTGIEDDAFRALVVELLHLEPVALAAPAVSEELRWRYIDDAVAFAYRRTLPVDFALFVQQVDIARTIQFMNDYLGGVVVPLEHDANGRPTRQAERNIYLPQPNYLVLYDGKPIDVSKLEVVEYEPDRHRLYWKTILSDNGSAVFDDGIATFERVPRGVEVTVTGRQQFILPTFLQVFDPGLVPGLKDRLVTHAYQTFFDRTIANFEALLEGRDIRIGRPVDEFAPPPVERLMPLLEQIGTLAMPLVQHFLNRHEQTSAGALTDADGFVHIVPHQERPADPQQAVAAVAQFVDDLGQAIRRDLLPTGGTG